MGENGLFGFGRTADRSRRGLRGGSGNRLRLGRQIKRSFLAASAHCEEQGSGAKADQVKARLHD
nr:hypothetical protein [Noviherbaspirillum sp. UKPF54]